MRKIAFEIVKHSGQSFGGIVYKGNRKIYDDFLALISNINGDEGIDNFLHSLHHKIDTHQSIFNLIGYDQTKLQNFFTNNFNEDEHKQYKTFFDQLIVFIYEVYQDKSIENKVAMIYATLRFVKFIQGDKR